VRRKRFFERGSFGIATVIFSLAISTLCGYPQAQGELHWTKAKKEPIKVRLIALAWNHQRSSFFASEEIFIAEKQLDRDESRFVKLIYGFLPYQPRLSESGFDYATVYEIHATRDEGCDESLSQITSGDEGDWRQAASDLKYSADAPAINLERSKSSLPCYRTSPEDYSRAVQDPPKESLPVLSVR
jgi:hypothetical protein